VVSKSPMFSKNCDTTGVEKSGVQVCILVPVSNDSYLQVFSVLLKLFQLQNVEPNVDVRCCYGKFRDISEFVFVDKRTNVLSLAYQHAKYTRIFHRPVLYIPGFLETYRILAIGGNLAKLSWDSV